MDNLGVLAIDFGTTNSYYCKCPIDQLSPVGVDFGLGKDGIATAVLYRGDKEALAGDSAINEFCEAPREQRQKWNLRAQFKPDIGRSEEASKNAEDFLRTVLVQSERQSISINPTQRHVIVGTPSEAEDGFKTRLVEVARAAGYGSIRLVDEPKGALLYHLWHKDFSPAEARKGILVVDFGGGTCDFAFLRRLEVRHSWGDMELGGRLFDDLFFQWFLEQNTSALRAIEQENDTYYVHSCLCREVKEFFSRTMARDRSETLNKSVGRYGSIRGMTWSIFISRAKSYKLSQTFIRYLSEIGHESGKLMQPGITLDLLAWFRQCLIRGFEEKKIDRSEIARVILVGGSSQWPFVPDILCEVLELDWSKLMRSDRPYAVISEGLAILPALQRKFQQTRDDLRKELPQFCKDKLGPLVQKNVDTVITDIAAGITLDLFDKRIKPILLDFRESGGSVASLKKHISSKAKAFEPELKRIVEEKMSTLKEGLAVLVFKLVAEWFESNGLALGGVSTDIGKMASARTDDMVPEAPNLYGGIIDLVSWFAVGFATSIGGMICGGAGTAILASGPIGWIVGAVLATIVAILTFRYGAKRARELAEHWNAPAWIIKMVLTKSKMTKTGNRFRDEIENRLRESLSSLLYECQQRIRELTETQIETLTEIDQL